MPIAISKLKSQLLTSELQQKNPALFQLINGIIDNLLAIQLVATSNGNGNIINEFNTILSLSGLDSDSGGDDGGMGMPGPPGIQGITGLTGPMGAIIFPPDAEDGDIFPPIVGPQGNPGPTGSQGPVSGYFPVEDGLDGEDGFNIAQVISSSSGISDIAIARKAISEAELEALNTSPLDIGIAAPGANKIICPLFVFLEVDLASVYTSSPAYTIVYDGSTSNLMATSLAITLTSGIDKKANSAAATGIAFSLYTTFDPRNKIIRLRGNANPTGSGSATGVVNVIYGIITTT